MFTPNEKLRGIALRILSNIRILCTEGITSFEVCKTPAHNKITSKKLKELDFDLRSKAGFSYIWMDKTLYFLEICNSSNVNKLASKLEVDKNELVWDKKHITEEMWNQDVPRIFYASLRESVANHSPGKVLFREKRKFIFPDISFGDDLKGLMHGLLVSSYRVDKSGLALSADYIRNRTDNRSEKQYIGLLTPDRRWHRTETLLDQMVPNQGLGIQMGGNELRIPSKSLSLKLKERKKIE